MCDNVNCDSDRVVYINAKSSDLNFVEFKNKKQDGYMPDIKNVGGGDYVDPNICLECGKVQGTFPVSDPKFDVDEDECDGCGMPEDECVCEEEMSCGSGGCGCC